MDCVLVDDYTRTPPRAPKAVVVLVVRLVVVDMLRLMRKSPAPVNGFSAGLWRRRGAQPLFGPRARRLKDDLLEVVAADHHDREIEPTAFADQPAADGLSGRRPLGDAHRVR